MLRKVISMFAIAAFALVLAQTGFSTPTVAQTSCMHCNFAQAKCKRFNTTNPEKCTAEKTACVKKCEATKDSTAGTSNRLKAADTPKTKK